MGPRSPIADGLATVSLPLPASLCFSEKSSDSIEGAPVNYNADDLAENERIDEKPYVDANRCNGSDPFSSLSESKVNSTKEKESTNSERDVKVGDEVKYSHGLGKVLEVREDGVHVVEAKGWYMANGKKPIAYVQKSQLKWAQPKTPYEMNPLEAINEATELKCEAARNFSQGKITEACVLYSKVLTYLLYVDRNQLTDMEKAQILELLIPCHNNVATCKMRLNDFKGVIDAAKSAEQYCEAMEPNRKGNVMKCLEKRGVSQEKLFINWYRKALFFQGKAYFYQKEYEDALTCLQKALQKTVNQPGALKDELEIRKFLDQANRQVALNKRKAKKMWKGAFDKNAEEDSAEAPPNGAVAPVSHLRALSATIDGAAEGGGKKAASHSTKRLEDILQSNQRLADVEDSDTEADEDSCDSEVQLTMSTGLKIGIAVLVMAGVAVGVSAMMRRKV